MSRLWRGNDVSVRQLVEDFARYLYLPRLLNSHTLVKSISEGLCLLTWEQDSFAWADERDEAAQRYRGLRCGTTSNTPDPASTGLLVKSEIALKQLELETKPVRIELSPERLELRPSATLPFILKGFDADSRPVQVSKAAWSATGGLIDASGLYTAGTSLGQFSVDAELNGLHARSIVVIAETVTPPPPEAPPIHVAPRLQRFHGTVVLDTERVGRDAGRIAEEIISHLAVQPGASVTVTLEIEAELPSGAQDGLVRTVTENARTLRFTSHGFERE